jgi:hypothetical protein
MNAPVCLQCQAPREEGPECPSCGVVYAKAEQRAALATGVVRPPPPRLSPAALFGREQALSAARAEMWLARVAVPGALFACWLLVQTDMGRFFLRASSGMWLHELGHATAAWLCGFPAFPGPWFTSVGDERSFWFAFALSGGLGVAVWHARATEDRILGRAALALLVLQLLATLAVPARSASTLISFAGDAGSLLFGAALMATFFAPPGHKLHRDWLRWGFLFLGAGSFTDTFDQWWTARTDATVIPFGEFEHGGPTDPSKLLMSGWTISVLVGRYVAVGVLCLLALAVGQILHVRRTRASLLALEAGAEPDSAS